MVEQGSCVDTDPAPKPASDSVNNKEESQTRPAINISSYSPTPVPVKHEAQRSPKTHLRASRYTPSHPGNAMRSLGRSQMFDSLFGTGEIIPIRRRPAPPVFAPGSKATGQPKQAVTPTSRPAMEDSLLKKEHASPSKDRQEYTSDPLLAGVTFQDKPSDSTLWIYREPYADIDPNFSEDEEEVKPAPKPKKEPKKKSKPFGELCAKAVSEQDEDELSPTFSAGFTSDTTLQSSQTSRASSISHRDEMRKEC